MSKCIMAYPVPPPTAMNIKGDVDSNWKMFKQSWEYYSQGAELSEKDKTVQVGILCSVMGSDCLRIMNSLTTLTDQDKKDPARIIAELSNHFEPQKHVLFERYKFNSANQSDAETVDQYVMRLRQLAKSCEYGNLEESLIRDRLVMGTHDARSRDRLLRDRPVPDLQRCVDTMRASELQRAHQMDRPPGESPLHALHATSRQTTGKKYSRGRPTRDPAPQKTPEQEKTFKRPRKCICCGGRHKRRKELCPAYGKVCDKCKKENHFASECLSRKVHHLELEDSDTQAVLDDESDDSIYSLRSGDNKSAFIVSLEFHADEIPNATSTHMVQLDSGAFVSAMSIDSLKSILQTEHVKLQKSNSKVRFYDNRSIRPLGRYELGVSSIGSNAVHNVSFEILESAPWPIIDGDTCLKVGWLQPPTCGHISTVLKQEQPVTREYILKEYKDVFTGLGCLPGDYHIEIDEQVRPVHHAPRRIPVPLRAKMKAKLDELEQSGIIKKVTTPTDWISSSVAVLKGDKLRLCIDPKDLNKAIKRPKYQIPTIDEVLPNLAKAKVFSILDAKDGFFQVKLDEESSYLTTFWAGSFGRYRYTRCPFGLSSASEEYQRRQKEVLEGLHGVDVIADDIICYGCGDTVEQATADHDRNIIALLDRAREVNLKLNAKKMRLRLKEVPYMGHLLTDSGVKPDPAKIDAIINMPKPTDAKAVQRLLGSVNYLAKFLPCLSDVSEPLRRLTQKDIEWHWEVEQEHAYKAILQLITTTPVLKYYDLEQEVTVQSDASEAGLGAVLLQQGQPIAFASRSLSETERGYSQIEKEALAIVFACERYDQYLHGRSFRVETDHKPLEAIVKKPIHKAPKRLQRMLMRLQKYSMKVEYVPGPQMYISDMLSRAFVQTKVSKDMSEGIVFQLQREDELFQDISEVSQVQHMSLSDATHAKIQKTTAMDPVLQAVATTVLSGWPETKDRVPVNIRHFWSFRDELTVQDGILYKGMQVVIPRVMQAEMLAKVHRSHLGAEATLRRAQDVMFWPNMASQLKDTVEACAVCNELADNQQQEPMMSHKLPTLPWAKVAQDLFTVHGKNYVVTVDYYSDFFEVDELDDTSAESVVKATKAHFARYGIADMVTDNGPQYTSQVFSDFSREWEFNHVTSSPYHSRSNGKAEAAVKVAKKMLKKTKRDGTDFQMALLEHRNTPDKFGYSSVQKLQARRTRTTVPTNKVLLKPQVVEGVDEQLQMKRQKAKQQYDRHAKPLPELEIGEPVMIQPLQPKQPWSRGSCVAKVGPRSYLVESESGQMLRRNRKFIRQDKSRTVSPSAHEQDTTHISNPEKNLQSTPTENHQPVDVPSTPRPKPSPPKRDPRPAQSATKASSANEQYTTRTGRAVKPRKVLDL